MTGARSVFREEMEEMRTLLIALNTSSSVSRASICRLALTVESWWRAANGDAARLGQALAVQPETLERALALRRNATRLASRELERAAALDACVSTLLDPDYPAPLRDLSLPPPVLYWRGTLPEAPGTAVVGPRRADPWALEVAGLFARELARSGLVVVSGFARGVDEAAHRGALEVEAGRTVAVLGCGLGVDYPRRRGSLRREIAQRGALVTEFPIGAEPRPWHFPVRNRIIAALGLGTLVVQASHRSGSLSTARHALELGREIWAVPGRIFDVRSVGSNSLIRDGAHLVQHPREILESLPLAAQRGLLTVPAPPREPGEPSVPGPAGRLLRVIAPGDEVSAGEAAERSGLAIATVLGALVELELGGWIRRHPGPTFFRPP